MPDRELIERLRRLEAPALREFFARFYPLLQREARALGVTAAVRDDVVVQCLDDAAIALMRHTTPVPRSLAAYLLTALRHDALNARAAESRRRTRARTAVREGPAPNESVVSEVCSEYALSASGGPDRDDAGLAPVLQRLAVALDAELDDDERRLLVWLGHWVPQRLIGEWLGVSYGAVRARVLRLRVRLRDAAERYARQLPEAEQRELWRFFRRTSTRCEPAPGAAVTSKRVRVAVSDDQQRAPISNESTGVVSTQETDDVRS